MAGNAEVVDGGDSGLHGAGVVVARVKRLVAQRKRGCVELGARRGNALVVPSAVPVQVADVVVAVLLAGDHAPGCSGFALAPPDIDTAAPPDAARLVQLVMLGALSEIPTPMSTVDATGTLLPVALCEGTLPANWVLPVLHLLLDQTDG